MVTVTAAALVPLLATLTVAQPPQTIQEVARRIVSDLTLAHIGELNPWHEVAVAADDPSPDSQLLASRVAGYIGQIGFTAPIILDATTNLAVASANARSAGAEWLIFIEGARASTRASLRWVEPDGLWGPPPEHPVTFATSEPSTLAPPPEIATPKNDPAPERDATFRATPPVKLAEIDIQVLSIAVCKALDGEESLAILGADEVRLYAGIGGRLKLEQTLKLTDRPRSKKPVRAQTGQIVCRGNTLAFGHGRLASGYLVKRDTPDTATWQPLSGIPHGFGVDGRVLVSRYTQGTHHFTDPPLWSDGAPASIGSNDWSPALSRSYNPEHPPGWRVLIIDELGKWIRRTEGGAPELSASSGRGSSLHIMGDSWIATTSSLQGHADQDQVRVFDPRTQRNIGGPFSVDGEVRATVLTQGFLSHLGVIVATWRPSLLRSELYLIALGGDP